MPNNPTAPVAPAPFVPSVCLPVTAFRQILWLPLRCKTDAPLEPSQLMPHWQRLEGDLLMAAAAGATPTESADSNAAAYGTYLYFHPYIRRFLFDSAAAGGPAKPPMSVWQLGPEAADQSHFMDVLMPVGQYGAADAMYTLRFCIDRCLLYCFDRVVMLEVELNWTDSLHAGSWPTKNPKLSLAQVLDTLDFLRRTHPGYFPALDPQNELSSTLHLAGGRYPLAVALRPKDHAFVQLQVQQQDLAARKRAFLNTVAQRERSTPGYAAPMGEPWRNLLGPVADCTLQLEDDRMPYMAYVAVPDPHKISDGDWVRLAGADFHGDSASHPYAPNFLKGFAHEHFYDRFFDPEKGWTNTRFLNTGYAFTMVGASGQQGDPSAFFATDGLRHFRRSYACIGLLAQFNKAALLLFSNRLAEAVDLRKKDDGKLYRERVRQIQGDLLEFSHRHWFDGVSNQLQAGELQAYWFKHLRLQALYDSVMAEARAAHDYVIATEERLQTQAVERLTKGALAVALLGLLLAAMGAGFPYDKALALFNDKFELAFCIAGKVDCVMNWPRTLTLAGTLIAALALAWHLYVLRRNATQMF